ncbi:MAG: carboxymuconolactone decarboxylase family protein [Dongiaceae bacterium]
MTRIDLPRPALMNKDDREQYDRFPANLTRALLRTRGCTAGYLDLGYALINTSLNAKQRELVILRVAALSRSAYERMQHLPPAKKAGWTDADIAAIERGQGGQLDPASAALLYFVDECVKDVHVSDRTFIELRQFLSEEAVADATLLTGFYMMTARFLETLSVDLDEAPSDILTEQLVVAS